MNQLFKGTGSYAKEALMHDVCKTQGDVVVTCGKVVSKTFLILPKLSGVFYC